MELIDRFISCECDACKSFREAVQTAAPDIDDDATCESAWQRVRAECPVYKQLPQVPQ